MIQIKSRNLITGEELNASEIHDLIQFGIELKRERKLGRPHDLLAGKQLALFFDKPSLRTRMSFSVAMNDLGGATIESVSSSRKAEEPEDLARVLSGYVHGVVVRTHQDSWVTRMASVSSIPVINGLTDLHHPCQILADLMTLQETYGELRGVTLSYVGDGNNILNSLILLCSQVGMNLKYSCPVGFQPDPQTLEKGLLRAHERHTVIQSEETPRLAVRGAQAVYTDVWTSMGFEAQKQDREKAFESYQVNEGLMDGAAPKAVVMHCLPMERGKEISTRLPDSQSSVIFQQSENRLHIQKALLVALLRE
jgi:ornithine carbamoyltransferase